MIEKKGDLKTQEIPYCERKCLNQGLTVTVNQCIFVGLSCAVSCEGCSKNPAPSEEFEIDLIFLKKQQFYRFEKKFKDSL